MQGKRKFWDMTKPDDCRAFLRDVRSNGKPLTHIKTDTGETLVINDMTDAQIVVYANQVLDLIENQKHSRRLPLHSV